jgi:hypothetical protein
VHWEFNAKGMDTLQTLNGKTTVIVEEESEKKNHHVLSILTILIAGLFLWGCGNGNVV